MGELRIREAVGAIVFQEDEYLLIHKVKVMDGARGVEDTPGTWDFPKGGVNPSDDDLEAAVLRELKEETGSSQYRIVKKFDKIISFAFPKSYKFDRQNTTMFYVEYLGDRTDLKPQDEEIDQVKFLSKNKVKELLSLEETIEFLEDVSW